jgi:hypothetical protein
MTRKDYIILAEALSQAWLNPDDMKDRDSEGFADGLKAVRHYIVKALKQDNPRFDKDKFVKATGF